MDFPSFSSFPTASLIDASSTVAKRHSGTQESDSQRKHTRKKESKKHQKAKPATTDAFIYSSDGSILFYYDRQGEWNNLKHDSVRDSPVPVYKRWSDWILGLTSLWRISKRNKRQVVLTRSDGLAQCDAKSGIARYDAFKHAFRQKPSFRLIERKPQSNSTVTPGFVSIVDDEDEIDDDKTGFDIDVDLTAFESDLEFMSRTKQLNAEIQNSPDNVAAWLALARLQDDLMVNVPKNKHAALKRSIADKKMSILDSALSQHPSSDVLLTEYMTQYALVNDPVQVLDRWESVLHDFPTSFKLLNAYMDVRQTNFASFTVSGCLESYQDCIRRLQYHNSGGLKEETILCCIFRRACALLLQSGFKEKAIAAYQALIEFNCYCPKAFRFQTFEQRLGLFEAFWDTECPRFAENGAKGWENSLMDLPADNSLNSNDTDIRTEQEAKHHDLYFAWALQESQKEFLQWLPARTDDEAAEQDPFRAVVFDDIKPLMFEVVHPETRLMLVEWLMACFGSPFESVRCSNDVNGLRDAMTNDSLSNPIYLELFADKSMDGENERSVAFPFKAFVHSRWMLHGDGTRFPSILDSCVSDGIDALSAEGRQTIVTILQQMKGLFNDCLSLPRLLVLESCFEGNQIDSVAKRLLKKDRMNLHLWATYAQTLYNKGKIVEARNLFANALMTFKTFPKEQQNGAFELFVAFADFEWQMGKVNEPLVILLCLAEDVALPGNYESVEPPSPTRVLKAKKQFESLINEEWERMDFEAYSDGMLRACNALDAFALVELLTRDINSAHELYDRFLAKSPKGSLFQELVYQSLTRMHYLSRMTATAFKPHVLRDVSTTAIQLFPTNTYFLTIFGWNEARTGFENRVRRLIDETFAKHPSELIILFSLWSELHQRSHPNRSSFQSAIEKALDHPKCQHCVSLWYLAIATAVERNETDRAKSLFYRAIRECPWAKDLYMLAFSKLAQVFSDAEKNDIYILMEDKELRIRTGIETIDAIVE